MSVADDLKQLADQQALTVGALQAMLEGHWSGSPPSLEAILLAIDPALGALTSVDYLLTSEQAELGPEWWEAFDLHETMPPQSASWTCSACSLAWVERASKVRQDADEWTAVDEIGTPQNINATFGLMDGSGSQLRRVLQDSHGIPSSQGWLSFDQAYAIYANTAGMMSGGNWYHWVGVRGHDGANLWIANSAPGYKGIYDSLSREDFNRLGPFSCVWLEH